MSINAQTEVAAPIRRREETRPDSSRFTASSRVRTNQRGVHPALRSRVSRHLESRWRQPLHAPSVAAFEELLARRPEMLDQPLVLDSGCGTGSSTPLIAGLHPDCFVLGIDRSQARLSRGPGSRVTSLPAMDWVQADLPTLWRLLCQSGVCLRAHYLLYPNPWPKAAQLARRWHGHPVLRTLIKLGGKMEMRCNWKIYADEFALAMHWATGQAASVERLTVARPISLFEQKYAASGHALWGVKVGLPAG